MDFANNVSPMSLSATFVADSMGTLPLHEHEVGLDGASPTVWGSLPDAGLS